MQIKYATLTFVGNCRGRHVGLLVLVLDDDLDLPPDEGRIFAGHWHPFLVVGLGGGGRRRRRNLRRLGVGLCSLGHVGAVRTAEDAGEGAVGVEHIYAADLKLCQTYQRRPRRPRRRCGDVVAQVPTMRGRCSMLQQQIFDRSPKHAQWYRL